MSFPVWQEAISPSGSGDYGQESEAAVFLTGRKQIAEFVGRSWDAVLRWIYERNFPARKMGGVWESDEELVREWRRNQILSSLPPGRPDSSTR